MIQISNHNPYSYRGRQEKPKTNEEIGALYLSPTLQQKERYKTCPACNGDKHQKRRCAKCRGTGTVRTGRK